MKTVKEEQPMEWEEEYSEFLDELERLLKEYPEEHHWAFNFGKKFIYKALAHQKEQTVKEMIELFTKKTENEKGEPICPKCGRDMERDCMEPQGYLWFCKCSPGLRLSVG